MQRSTFTVPIVRLLCTGAFCHCLAHVLWIAVRYKTLFDGLMFAPCVQVWPTGPQIRSLNQFGTSCALLKVGFNSKDDIQHLFDTSVPMFEGLGFRLPQGDVIGAPSHSSSLKIRAAPAVQQEPVSQRPHR